MVLFSFFDLLVFFFFFCVIFFVQFYVLLPHNAVALILKIGRASAVRRAVSVLTTVDLDDKPKLVAREIAEIRADRRLTAEMEILERLLSQVRPQLTLGIGYVAT